MGMKWVIVDEVDERLIEEGKFNDEAGTRRWRGIGIWLMIW